MSSLSHLGLSLLCATLLLSLPAHGSRCNFPGYLSPDGVLQTCCTDTSTDHIPDPIKACTEQMELTFQRCPIHAFILTTVSNMSYCVDPEAEWLPRKLKELEQNGIRCNALKAVGEDEHEILTLAIA